MLLFQVKNITGDSLLTTLAIADRAHFKNSNSALNEPLRTVTGEELLAMTDGELEKTVGKEEHEATPPDE